MALLDFYDPENFADGGGLLARMISLHPGLAPDEQSVGSQTAQATMSQPKNLSTPGPVASALGNALGDFYNLTIRGGAKTIAGYAHDAVTDPAYFLHAIGPSLAGVAPIAGELPTVRDGMGAIKFAGSAIRSGKDIAAQGDPVANEVSRPLQSNGQGFGHSSSGNGNASGQLSSAWPVGSVARGTAPQIGQNGLLPALALAATLASQRSNELLGGRRRPAMPLFPEPPVAPVPPQTPSMPPAVAPVAPQAPTIRPDLAPVAPQLGPIPEPGSVHELGEPPGSFDSWQNALGPEWEQLQSYFDNTRDKGGGTGEEPEVDCEENVRWARARCTEQPWSESVYDTGPYKTRGPRRIPLEGPWTINNCMKGFLHPKCGGNDSKDPANWYTGRSKKGRRSRL
jgi:hypothetical protein